MEHWNNSRVQLPENWINCTSAHIISYHAITCGFFVSTFFLFLTIIVYLILLRETTFQLQTLLQFFYTFSMLFVYAYASMTSWAVTATLIPMLIYKSTRIIFRMFGISSSFWLTCLNIEIWQTFRNFQAQTLAAQAQTILPNKNRKFLTYFLISFGVPVCLGVASMQLESNSFDTKNGSISTQQNCRKLFNGVGSNYFYVPFSILHLFNLFLFLWTWFNILNARRNSTRMKQPPASCINFQTEGFSIFMKLFTLMGTVFTLDAGFWVLCMLYYEHAFEITTYAIPVLIFGSLQGVGVFYILVCKKEILMKLKNKFL